MNIPFSDSTVYLNTYTQKLMGSTLSFQIHYWGSVIHFDHPLHKHSFFEVCYVTSGTGIYTDNLTTFPLSEGTLFMSRPDIWHKISSREGVGLIYVGFEMESKEDPSFAEKVAISLQSSEQFYFQHANLLPTVQIWFALHQLASGSTFLPDEQLSSLAQALLLSFLQLFTAPRQMEPLNQSSVTFDQHSFVLHQAKLFIADNLAAPIHPQELANYLHISERHLMRLFAKELGQSLSSYVRQERIRRASTYLKTSLLSIKQIAEETGFGSVHHFTRTFKHTTGMNPGEYRKSTD